MTKKQPPREITFFECDHMRPVVIVDGKPYHIMHNGELSSAACGVGHVYRQKGTSDAMHYINDNMIGVNDFYDAEKSRKMS